MSDLRSKIIRLASSFAEGSSERRALLAVVTAADKGLPSMPDLRKPVYKLGDGVQGVLAVVKGDKVLKADKKLQKLIEDIQSLEVALAKHLDATYNWD